MALSPGTRLGPYEILGPLGAGGMGEVYRAHDPRLEREVAIKVLPEEVTDRDRLRRFEKEARATGGLNHPNILTIYDIGAHEGRPYLVGLYQWDNQDWIHWLRVWPQQIEFSTALYNYFTLPPPLPAPEKPF